MIPAERRRSWVARQVGTLALSHVEPGGAVAPLRAAAWQNALGRLGLHLPWFVTHDLGALLTTPPGRRGAPAIAPRAVLERIAPPARARGLLSLYQELLEQVAASEVVEKAASWHLRDDLVAALLARALGSVFHRFADPGKSVGAEPLPLDPRLYQDLGPDDIAACFADFDAKPLWAFLGHLVDNRLQIYTALEQIDLDTLRVLGVFADGAAAERGGAAVALDLVDLLGVFQSAEANDVVDFSLDLLPSVLETKRASGAQTFAVDGYASIERTGSVDSLLLTEFAWDAELFERKVADNELYYYGRERQRQERRRLQYLLIDASPSMRGVRQVFARGLALALSKELALRGDEVWFRFFDSRLYEVQRGPAVPYLLSFRSERGRNYGKVFRQLLVELERLRREERREIAVHLITHGQCHLPVELVQRLAAQAYLYGVFVLPSSEVRLEYLSALHRHQVVDAAALASRDRRRERAIDILRDAGERTAPAPRPERRGGGRTPAGPLSFGG